MQQFAAQPSTWPGGVLVSVAVVCTVAGHELAADSVTRLTGDLAAALRGAGAQDVRVLSRAGRAAAPGAAIVESPDLVADLRAVAAVARATRQPLLLCADDLVTHPRLLHVLATEPAGRSTVLVSAAAAGTADVRQERGRIVPPGDDAPPNARFLGALWVAPDDLALLADVADGAAEAAAGQPASGVGVEVRRRAGSAVDLLLPALLAAGLSPVATGARLLRAERAGDETSLAAARAAVAAVDEDDALLRMAVKEHDDFFTTYAVSSWSPVVTRWAARLGLTPSGVTGLSVLFAVAAALAFWQASRPAMIAGAVLLYLGFVLDCVDGQLARYTRSFGAFGGWLDTMADRAKEYAAYAGLAAGAERIGLADAWPLAIAAMLLQTVRHMTDAWYGVLHDRAVLAGGGTGAGGGLGARLGRASNRVQADTGSAAYWLKRIVVFPIGERWALIAVTAALFNGRVALTAVLTWGLVAAGYTAALRGLRSRAMRVPVLDVADRSRHRDDGALARFLLGRSGVPGPLPWALIAVAGAGALAAAAFAGWIAPGRSGGPVALAAAVLLVAGLPAGASHGGPLDWLVPAALRAAEYLFIVAVGLSCDVPPPAVFGALFVTALHHYDVTARMEKSAPQGAAGSPVLGWDGRVVLVTAAVVAGVPTAGIVTLAVVVGVIFGIRAVAARRGPPARPHPSSERWSR